MKRFTVFCALVICLSSSTAWAHFQMLYTPESALPTGKIIELRHVFTHPFADEHTMDMGLQHDSDKLLAIEEFYVVNKGKKKDLAATLQEIEWQGQHNRGKGYKSTYKAQRMGDHVLVLQPAPYFEAGEDIYIQQITKTIVNVAGAPTDWDAELGLKAEIVPLVKPYSIWAGSTFTGIVKSNGRPVPYAEIEVEYLNRAVDLEHNATGTSFVEAPQDSFVTLGMKADVNGIFTFGIPRAGWWGFAAMGVGSDTSYKGKELSQDAVIWVQAKEMH